MTDKELAQLDLMLGKLESVLVKLSDSIDRNTASLDKLVDARNRESVMVTNLFKSPFEDLLYRGTTGDSSEIPSTYPNVS